MRTSEKMEFPTTLVVTNRIYEIVDIQRGGLSAIYTDTKTFLRIGAQEKILKDLEVHKTMEAMGYPVLNFLRKGKLGA